MNPIGHATSISNNVDAASNISYDSMGRVTKQTYCVPGDCSYSIAVNAQYDLAGNLTQLTYPDGRVITQAPDIANRLSTVTYASWNGTPVNAPFFQATSYAPAGQLTGAQIGNGAIALQARFDNRQRISSLSYANSTATILSKGYTWGSNGSNLQEVQDGSTALYYGYDNLDRLTSVAGDGTTSGGTFANGKVTIAGQEIKITVPTTTCNGANPPSCNTTYSDFYDAGTVTLAAGGSTFTAAYGEGSTANSLAAALAGNMNASQLIRAVVSSSCTPTSTSCDIALTSSNPGSDTNYALNVSSANTGSYLFKTPSFSMSSSGALSGGTDGTFSGPNAINEAYTYDPWGNLNQSGNFNFAQPFTAQNQIQGYSYDSNGRLLNDEVGNTYTYNVDGFVTQAEDSDGAVYSYDYDAQGNRVATYYADYGASVFLYFGGRMIGTLAPGNQWTDYIYAGGNLLAEVVGTQDAVPVYQITDHLGSLAATAGGDGAVITAWQTMPYGQTVQGDTTDQSGYIFAGLFRDFETGSDHADFRQYQSAIGGWMSPDPYGGSYHWNDPQSLNRYSYVRGMPMAATDPSGQDPCAPAAGLGFAFGGPVGEGVGVGVCIGFAIYDAFKLIEMLLGEPSPFKGTLQSRPNAGAGSGGACDSGNCGEDFMQASKPAIVKDRFQQEFERLIWAALSGPDDWGYRPRLRRGAPTQTDTISAQPQSQLQPLTQAEIFRLCESATNLRLNGLGIPTDGDSEDTGAEWTEGNCGIRELNGAGNPQANGSGNAALVLGTLSDCLGGASAINWPNGAP